MKNLVLGLMFVLSMGAAHAAETYVMNVHGQYGQVYYTRTDSGWVSGMVSVDGSGVNQTAFVFATSYSQADGYKFWRGNVPVSAVTVNGISSISVDVDTCAVEPINMRGCGYLNFTVTTDEPATGWIDNGVVHYSYGDYIQTSAGARQVRASSAEGSINGQAFSSSRAFMVKSSDVNIQITVGN